MALSSMTGFARADGRHAARSWSWETRSVNGRSLEMRFRLPPGFDSLEVELRRVTAARIARGSLTATLILERTTAAPALRVNEAALAEALRLVERVRAAGEFDRPRPEGVLALRGVLESDEGEGDAKTREELAGAIVKSYAQAIAALSEARRAEGAKLGVLLNAQIEEIARLVALARAHAEAAPEAIKARIAAQLGELLAGAAIPEDRLAQEASLLAIRADVREELDRLDAHVEAASHAMKTGEPVGRRLDFLGQEFNREANTLCAKAQDIGLKRIGLDLKTVVDQLREQVQNIE
jgi:uncharacterized protein (TIGR00255 family)